MFSVVIMMITRGERVGSEAQIVLIKISQITFHSQSRIQFMKLVGGNILRCVVTKKNITKENFFTEDVS
jgi:hypothetical protein